MDVHMEHCDLQSEQIRLSVNAEVSIIEKQRINDNNTVPGGIERRDFLNNEVCGAQVSKIYDSTLALLRRDLSAVLVDGLPN
jgi:hypothetical protein